MLRSLLAGAVLAALALGALAQTAAPTPPLRTINVTGTATRQVAPDLALVILAVQTQAPTVARATQANNQTANAVTQAITRLNIPRLTLRTLGYDVQPIYEQPQPGRPAPSPPRIIAYQVVNRLQVRVPDANPAQLSDAVSRVIDAALTAGANRVDSVQFTLENESLASREVMAEAARNARDTALALAGAAGVQLGPLVTLSTTSYQPPVPLYAARAASLEAAAAPPIMAGELTIQATVTTVYEIR